MFRTHLLVLTLLALGVATSALAVEAPDSGRAASLQAQADSAWRVRVTAKRATYVIVAPRIAVSGITLGMPDSPPALITMNAPSEARRLRWSDIERVEVERPTFAKGFGRGFLIGAGVVGAIALLNWKHAEGGEYESAYVLLVPYSMVTAGLIGGLLGGAGSSSRHPIYP